MRLASFNIVYENCILYFFLLSAALLLGGRRSFYRIILTALIKLYRNRPYAAK